MLKVDNHRGLSVRCLDGESLFWTKGELPSRVQIFDEKGRFVRSIGEWSIESGGWEPGELMESTGVAHGTGGEIIVSDKGRRDVQVFSGERGGCCRCCRSSGQMGTARWHGIPLSLSLILGS